MMKLDMSAATYPRNEKIVSLSLWTLAWKKLRADTTAMVAMIVVIFYMVILILSSNGLIANDWDSEVAVSYAPPSFLHQENLDSPVEDSKTTAQISQQPVDNPLDPLGPILKKLRAERDAASGALSVDMYGVTDPLAADLQGIYAELANKRAYATAPLKQSLPFGADKWGHDIILKTIRGGQISITVGLASAFVATLLGTIFGAISGYYGRWVDDLFNWFYSVFTSVPYMLLILAVAAVLQMRGVSTIVLILGLTGWTSVYRLIRAEYIKHKGREYVLAADAIGASSLRKMFVQIFPNISHVVLVQISILTVGFIKAEVILSFLGFGVPVGDVSWGSMLNEAQNELILGYWWQLVAATIAMAVLVTAFSIFTDALRDVMDPKLK